MYPDTLGSAIILANSDDSWSLNVSVASDGVRPLDSAPSSFAYIERLVSLVRTALASGISSLIAWRISGCQ